MAERQRSWVPSVISMSCFLTPLRGQVGERGWHEHEMDELCLITGSATCIIHGGAETRAEDGSLYLFRRGERHGFINRGREEPHLWVVHYRADEDLYRDCPGLVDRDPRRRMWRLDAERVVGFQTLFLRLLSEQQQRRVGRAAAASAWLRLMLVSAARWQDGSEAPAPAAPTTDAELLALWRLINDHVGAPADLAAAIKRNVPNYDSLRHRFRKVFKQSPRDLVISLRMERAKSLLLETDLAIAAVAERIGYGRQHEFARAFHREVGCTPTWWREHAGDNRTFELSIP
jgi:AraC-like DNA-binding protein